MKKVPLCVRPDQTIGDLIALGYHQNYWRIELDVRRGILYGYRDDLEEVKPLLREAQQ